MSNGINTESILKSASVWFPKKVGERHVCKKSSVVHELLYTHLEGENVGNLSTLYHAEHRRKQIGKMMGRQLQIIMSCSPVWRREPLV